jgi:hypothetical protein
MQVVEISVDFRKLMFAFSTFHKLHKLLKVLLLHAAYQADHFVDINFLRKFGDFIHVKVLNKLQPWILVS